MRLCTLQVPEVDRLPTINTILMVFRPTVRLDQTPSRAFHWICRGIVPTPRVDTTQLPVLDTNREVNILLIFIECSMLTTRINTGINAILVMK